MVCKSTIHFFQLACQFLIIDSVRDTQSEEPTEIVRQWQGHYNCCEARGCTEELKKCQVTHPPMFTCKNCLCEDFDCDKAQSKGWKMGGDSDDSEPIDDSIKPTETLSEKIVHKPRRKEMPEGFAKGIADALGFDDVTSCVKETHTASDDLWVAVEDYLHGDWGSKLKALHKFGQATAALAKAFEPCSSVLADVSRYRKLAKNLRDHRFYSLHNSLTLFLNLAEDRKQLVGFAGALGKQDFHEAGLQLMTTILDVLDEPDFPQSNGTAALQILRGFAKGFSMDLNDISCLKNARVEIPALFHGVLSCFTVVDIANGLKDILQGLMGLVPMIKHCMADTPKMLALIHLLTNVGNPAAAAAHIEHNLEENGFDITLEVASSVLDIKGKEWFRLGRDLGRMIGKLIVA